MEGLGAGAPPPAPPAATSKGGRLLGEGGVTLPGVCVEAAVSWVNSLGDGGL